jgi:hypothetical protein
LSKGLSPAYLKTALTCHIDIPRNKQCYKKKDFSSNIGREGWERERESDKEIDRDKERKRKREIKRERERKSVRERER